MTYNALHDMKESRGLYNRIVSAAALEGIDTPDTWAMNNMWPIIARPDWIDSWAYGEQTKTINHNPDTGERDDVISDAMVLAAVQARIAESAA